MAAEAKALQVMTLNDAELKPLAAPAVRKILERYLAGTRLTPDDLLLDLAQLMTVNPKLKDCTQQSLFQCLVFTARHKVTFGPNGVWVVPYGVREDDDGEGEADSKAVKPRGDKVLTATPQLAYKCQEAKAEERGWMMPPIIRLVYIGEPFEVVTDDAGFPIGVKHKIDWTKSRLGDQFTCGYFIARNRDGRQYLHVMTKAQLDKRRAASPSGHSRNPKVPWNKWTEEMYAKTLERAAWPKLVPDFTEGSGGRDADPGEGEEEPIEITPDREEQVKPVGQSAQLMHDLKPKPAPAVAAPAPTPPAALPADTAAKELQYRKDMFEAKKSGGSAALREYWKAHKAEMEALGQEVFDHLYAHLNELGQARQEDLV